MPDHLDSVKEYLRLNETWLKDAKAKGDESRVQTGEKRIVAMRGVIDELEELRRITKPIPASYGDLSDLPAELVKELSGIKVDDLEQQLFTIISSGGDEVDLDAILIELYRRFSVIQQRKFLQNKLWRMAQKEIIFSVQGRKGIYTSKKPEPDKNPFVAFAEATKKNAWDLDDDDEIPF